MGYGKGICNRLVVVVRLVGFCAKIWLLKKIKGAKLYEPVG